MTAPIPLWSVVIAVHFHAQIENMDCENVHQLQNWNLIWMKRIELSFLFFNFENFIFGLVDDSSPALGWNVEILLYFYFSRFAKPENFLACNRFFLLYSHRDLNFVMPNPFSM